MIRASYKSLAAVPVIALALFSNSVIAQPDGWQFEAEQELRDLLEKIRAEEVDGGACGGPPRAPGDFSDSASETFRQNTEAWDDCKSGYIQDLEDRVIDYQYQLDNWLPELPDGHRLIDRAFRTVDIYNRRVKRARDRAEREYEMLEKTQYDYADRLDTAIRQATWAEIEWEQKISDICISETTTNFGPYSELLFECIERKKREREWREAGYDPYVPYDPYYDTDSYDRIRINVSVEIQE